MLAGNLFDKYNTKNPIARMLCNNFLRSVIELVRSTGARDIYEAGCGEGALILHVASQIHGVRIRGSDFSEQVIGTARENAREANQNCELKVTSIYDLKAETDAAELVVCCEVFEHLEDPELALTVVSRLARPYLLVSVPREPLWRLLNVVRGKYIGAFGNTPGHLQHWSKGSFVRLLRRYVDIEEIRMPVPWIMVLCRSRGSTRG